MRWCASGLARRRVTADLAAGRPMARGARSRRDRLLRSARHRSQRDSRKPAGDAAACGRPMRCRPFTGDAFTLGDPHEANRELMDFLQGCLEFKAVRPGAAGATVGLSAELHITGAALPAPQPLVLAKMPDIAYLLAADARRSCAAPRHPRRQRRRAGDPGLPVEIRLPAGFVRPAAAEGNMSDAVVDLPEFETTNAPFNAADPDSLQHHAARYWSRRRSSPASTCA